MNSIDQIVEFLTAKKLLLATVESCTAGLQASMLADISGCGAVLQEGFIVYARSAKESSLGVSAQTIDTFGLTSEEVAREMAIGALQRSKANIVLANTGKAESDDDLDGVVCFACAMKIEGKISIVSETVHFSGSRNAVRTAAARYGLQRVPYYYEFLHREFSV